VLFFLGSWSYGQEIGLTARHIVIITSDGEGIMGTYFFAVQNRSAVPTRFRCPIMLPKESDDFQAQDGFRQEELELDGRQVILNKEFPPGLTLLGIGFHTKAALFGDDVLTFTLPSAIKEFSLAVPSASSLVLESGQFRPGLPAMLAASTYRGLLSENLVAGEVRQIVVKGIPKVRHYLYCIAAACALLLLVGAACLVRVPRKRK
jgi:hypothetical protein